MIKGLYIHIPFCAEICSYCDFSKMVANLDLKKIYVDTLIEELKYHQDKYSNLETIYIGGGTPTNLDNNLLEELLFQINKVVDVANLKEFTIEANPNDITDDLGTLLKENNISRISLGVQTSNDSLLKILNRNHKNIDVENAVKLLRDNQIENINLDFIYGIPNQTKKDVINDIAFIKKLNPSHISYYSLILEENTKLLYDINKSKLKALNDDLVADYSDLITESLKELGYTHYETSNYAKPGLESLHNLIYWNLEEYLGIGLSAASQYNNHRYKNQSLITKYNENFKVIEEEDFDPLVEFLLMGLRKTKGINLQEFKDRFNRDLFTAFPNLKRHLGNGLLVKENNILRFTNLGINLANQVYLDII